MYMQRDQVGSTATTLDTRGTAKQSCPRVASRCPIYSRLWPSTKIRGFGTIARGIALLHPDASDSSHIIVNSIHRYASMQERLVTLCQ